MDLPNKGLKNLMNKKELINSKVWDQKSIPVHEKIEGAIDNHIDNIV